MIRVYGHYKYFLLIQCADRLQSSESDVYRRQILTTKVDPRAVRAKVPKLINEVHINSKFNRSSDSQFQTDENNNCKVHKEKIGKRKYFRGFVEEFKYTKFEYDHFMQ